MTTFPMYKRSRKGIGYLSQESSIFRGLTVRQNIALVVERLGLSKSKQREKIQHHLEDLNLVELQNQKAISLSGGERRRTEVARALATNPNFLLLDEPFVGIDPITAEELQNIIQDLKRRNIGVLITDHNVHETLAITDRAYLLVNGKIMREGTGEALASDEMVKQQYLGKNFTLSQ
jgi:lipopolysaccharide export system ATP-binding protein